MVSAAVSPVILGLGGCGSDIGPPGDLGGGTGNTTVDASNEFTSNGLNYRYDSSSSSVGLTISDPSDGSELSFSGSKNASGLLTSITRLSGSTSDVSAFSALFADGLCYRISLPSAEIEIVDNGDGTLTLTVRTPSSVRAARTTISEVTFETANAYRMRVVDKVLHDDCKTKDCSWEVRQTLRVLEAGIKMQTLLNALFELECIEADTQDAGFCFELLGIIDTIGVMMDGLVAADDDLPDRVRALCFNLSANCKEEDAADLLDDGGSASVSITGATTICVDDARTYAAEVSGYSGQVIYYWAVTVGSGSLSATTGQSTKLTASAAGTLTLYVEARSTQTGNAVASNSVRVSASNTGECAPNQGYCCKWALPIIEASQRMNDAVNDPVAHQQADCDVIRYSLRAIDDGCDKHGRRDWWAYRYDQNCSD
jgi:hypothetical protein